VLRLISAGGEGRKGIVVEVLWLLSIRDSITRRARRRCGSDRLGWGLKGDFVCGYRVSRHMLIVLDVI
jgi:hypothetical protein